MRIFTIIFCILFFVVTAVFAAHPLTTDDIGTVDKDEYEIEVGYDNCKEEDILRNHSCGLSLKHGITEKMDIGISFPYQIEPKPEEPFGTTTLGFKFLLLKDIFALTVNNELGSREYFINGIFTREIKSVTVHANIGYMASGDETISGETIYSSAAEYPLAKINVVGEIIGEKTGIQNWLAGLRYKIGDVSAISCAYGNGFRASNEKIIFGFHSEF